MVDNNSKLLGTITDGDIRRGILSGINLDDSVKKIINKEPTKIFSEEINLALDLMIEKINQVPVVNLDNQVIGLKTLVELKHKSPIENFCHHGRWFWDKIVKSQKLPKTNDKSFREAYS